MHQCCSVVTAIRRTRLQLKKRYQVWLEMDARWLIRIDLKYVTLSSEKCVSHPFQGTAVHAGKEARATYIPYAVRLSIYVPGTEIMSVGAKHWKSSVERQDWATDLRLRLEVKLKFSAAAVHGSVLPRKTGQHLALSLGSSWTSRTGVLSFCLNLGQSI